MDTAFEMRGAQRSEHGPAVGGGGGAARLGLCESSDVQGEGVYPEGEEGEGSLAWRRTAVRRRR
jgi:hypothetical protein